MFSSLFFCDQIWGCRWMSCSDKIDWIISFNNDNATKMVLCDGKVMPQSYRVQYSVFYWKSSCNFSEPSGCTVWSALESVSYRSYIIATFRFASAAISFSFGGGSSACHHAKSPLSGQSWRYEIWRDMKLTKTCWNCWNFNFSCLLTQSGWWANSAEGQVLPQVDPAWQELADVKKNDDLYLCSITNSATLQSEILKAFSYF